MSGLTDHPITRRIPQRVARLSERMTWIAAGGAAVLLAGLWLSPERAWAALLAGSFAMVCLGLAGLVFVAIQYASGAVWSIVLRRVAEAMTAALPAGAAGILLVLLARPSLYPWHAHAVEGEGWIGFKTLWLSYPFFIGRAIIFICVWLAFRWLILSHSARQDQEGGAELSRQNTRASVIFLIAFAFTFWLAATDWVMSLEPAWSSTIFGIYHFSGMFVAGVAVVALLTVLLRETGPLRSSVTEDHLHDLGRLLIAFSTFWGYIWFSQYMLIWYTNLPEETTYIALRTQSGWGKLFAINVILNWALPFLVLLPGKNKRNPHTLAAAALLILAGRVTDLYVMILAPISPYSPVPSLWDLAALALVTGGFTVLALRAYFQAEPVPIGDPLLPASVQGHA